MRYLLGVFLCLVCLGAVAQQSSESSETLTTIESEAKAIQQDLKQALLLLSKSLVTQSEMQIVIENSKQRINHLEQITQDLEASYQKRIAGLKLLVSQLEARLEEQKGLNDSLASLESKSIKTLKAQEMGLRYWRMVAIIEVVIIVGGISAYLILK